MSCFILADELALEITFKEVNLDRSRNFGKSIFRLALEPVEFCKADANGNGIYSWTEPFTIFIDKQLVGATSPSTLFFTATDYSNVAEQLR
ncbi:hypothetical protein MASR2M39_29880 [Ignavibacteriales bacterium]